MNNSEKSKIIKRVLKDFEKNNLTSTQVNAILKKLDEPYVAAQAKGYSEDVYPYDEKGNKNWVDNQRIVLAAGYEAGYNKAKEDLEKSLTQVSD